MFNRFISFLFAHWFQTTLLAVLISFVIVTIEEHGLQPFIRWIRLKKLLFVFYLAFILFIAVFGRETGADPFTSVFDNFWPIDWEVEENIAAFVPLTFLYLFAYEKPKPIAASVKLSFAVSTFIEVSQMIGCLGSFQFSDILYNTIGGAFGGGAYLVVCWSVNKVPVLWGKLKAYFPTKSRG